MAGRTCQGRTDPQGKTSQVYKVIGDVRRKQGTDGAAFQNYLEHCGRMEAVLCERSFPEYFSQICMKEAREQLYMQKPEMLLSFESVGLESMEV
mgnify:CR=1 FL=1